MFWTIPEPHMLHVPSALHVITPSVEQAVDDADPDPLDGSEVTGAAVPEAAAAEVVVSGALVSAGAEVAAGAVGSTGAAEVTGLPLPTDAAAEELGAAVDAGAEEAGAEEAEPELEPEPELPELDPQSPVGGWRLAPDALSTSVPGLG